MKKISCLLAVICFFTVLDLSFAAENKEGFVPLFNGEDLTGWNKKGGDATYSVEDGCIVGKRGPGPNTFLCTDKKYRNFILKFDFKFDKDINSGVQFRSNARPDGDREVVFGYQCEMEPNVGMSGGIYDESRRNRWVDPLTEEKRELAKKSLKKDDWNTMTVQCVGPSIKTWLNGEMITDLIDTLELEGFIGLQVHGQNDDGQVRWKNIMIKELPDTPWVELFPSESEMTSVEIKPAGKWDVILKGTSTAGENRDGLILSNEDYKNCVIKVSFNQTKGNSGLYFGATPNDKAHWVDGFQGEIDDLATGGIWYVTGGRWIVEPPRDEIEKVFKRNDWNDFSTTVINGHIVTNLNGKEIANAKIEPELINKGKVGIQLHGGSDMEYMFKDFCVYAIPDEFVSLVETTVEP
ncbi:MAG: 3-keto-disaccharide hydrolase [Thermoguttaceae bacterium]